MSPSVLQSMLLPVALVVLRRRNYIVAISSIGRVLQVHCCVILYIVHVLNNHPSIIPVFFDSPLVLISSQYSVPSIEFLTKRLIVFIATYKFIAKQS